MSDLNFYDLLAALKIKKSKDINSIEASMKLIQELTSIKAQNELSKKKTNKQ